MTTKKASAKPAPKKTATPTKKTSFSTVRPATAVKRRKEKAAVVAPAPAEHPPPIDLRGIFLSHLDAEPERRWSRDGLLDELPTLALSKVSTTTADQVLADLAEAREIEQAEGYGHWLYYATPAQRAARVGSTPLGLAIIRALGEAQEPLPTMVTRTAAQEILGRRSLDKDDVLEALEALEGHFVRFVAEGWETLPASEAQAPARRPVASKKTPSSPIAQAATPPPPMAPFADLLAAARASSDGKTRRIKTALSAEALVAVESERASAIKTADELAIASKRSTSRARECTKTLRKGELSEAVRVVVVPDFERDLLVTVALTDPPRELKSKRLPAAYRQHKLPFQAPTEAT